MSQRDKRVDAYIAKAAPFARPILEHVRAVVHEACPDAEETIKWGMPTFTCGDGILCGMAAFKAHASFGFWKHALVVGEGEAQAGMGSFGRLATVRDLPPKKQLLAYVKKAAVLNAQGVKAAPARKSAAPKPAPEPTPEFAAALRKHKAAAAAFKAFSPGQQREYVEWIAEAKREDTRDRRIAQAVEWLAEGKQRNWKYM
jgi:uncharacterized protein YdeI (YjbR/CyaY-like superfamily)